MATLDRADWAKSIAADLLRHAERAYPDVDGATLRRAFALAAAELKVTIGAPSRPCRWGEALPPSATANPWQVEDD